ncbi:unnamed protein product [Haemonchus placei]|uniref:Cystatin domain-containing protein n=1 Tax=Haemonchus placei TaxID=6290 RepID=A0A0N4WXG7_HAEPC|nr:unnamed protein product [Haemonchus placei]
MLAGGLTDQSTDDPEFMEQAWKAATKVNEEANDGEYYMIPTKDVPVDQLKASNCAPKEGGKRVIYEISVLSQPWLNSEQVGVKVLRVLDPDEQV